MGEHAPGDLDWTAITAGQVGTVLFVLAVIGGLGWAIASSHKASKKRLAEEAEQKKRDDAKAKAALQDRMKAGLVNAQGKPVCVVCKGRNVETVATTELIYTEKHWGRRAWFGLIIAPAQSAGLPWAYEMHDDKGGARACEPCKQVAIQLCNEMHAKQQRAHQHLDAEQQAQLREFNTQLIDLVIASANEASSKLGLTEPEKEA